MSDRFRTDDAHRPYIDLVDRPAVLLDEDPIAFRRVRARVGELREWFGSRAGWSIVETRDLLRLVKTPSHTSERLGLGWATTPLDYELVAWVLWFGEREESEQFLLSQLVEDVAAQAAVSVAPGHMDWDAYAKRQALRRVLRALEEMGALRRLDGSTEEWADKGAGNTLYEFTALPRHLLVNQPDESLSDAAAATAVPPGQRLYRLLLLEPALFPDDDPEAFALLASRADRGRIAADLDERFGWDLEVGSSYACVKRPGASETARQQVFPPADAIGQVVLLLAGALRQRVVDGRAQPDSNDRIAITRADLEGEIIELRRRHGASWGATIGRLGIERLADEVIAVMRDHRLIEGPNDDGQLQISPLAARWVGRYDDERRAPDEGGAPDAP